MKLSALRPLLLLVLALWQSSAHADDFSHRFGAESYETDSAKVRALTVKVGALAFFKDNEFDGNVVKGYSLPGFRLQPRLAYRPIPQISMELGVHATVYEGANEYPSYVFHDIAKWKGSQYQRGAHALPFFRAAAHLHRPGGSRVTIAVGDIYGGATHSLLLPLYNPELLLTDDPEAGAQVLVDRPLWHSDVWVNWQSYIFEESTHQEAFTVGWAQRIRLLDTSLRSAASPCPTASPRPRHRLSIPLQLLVQHRGGEQDATDFGVQTIANAAVGLAWDADFQRRHGITAAHAEASGLFALQQSGTLWPFDFAPAFWGSASLTLQRDLMLGVGLFHAADFCSLYGSPFFGTLSVKYPGARFGRMTTGTWSLEYSRSFLQGAYVLGAKANGYLSGCGELRHPLEAGASKAKTDAARFRHTFSFGVYFRVCPEFVLKRWK